MEYRQRIAELEAGLARELEGISHYLYIHPELGLEEYLSADFLTAYLREKGFELERPWHGMDTAFAARWGTEGPCVAFLAEYDALPGHGPKGCDNGHSCGHNWIAATTVGAAVIVKELCAELGLPVRILLAGCPAEETFGSKSLLVREGAFDGVDCALQAHLSEETNLYHRSLALTAMELRYFGKSAHAAAAPWEGINALDAIQLYYAGVAALRQQLRPDVRLHGVIREGGKAANSIPERASCLYYARAETRAELDKVVQRLLDVAKGAELMTGARLEVSWPEQPMDELRHFPILERLLGEALAREGYTSISKEASDKRTVGSTDVGNVSQVCPTAFVEIGVEGFNCHTEEALALADGGCYDSLHRTVRLLADTAMRVVTGPDVRKKLWEEFHQ